MAHPGYPVGTPQTTGSTYFDRLSEAVKHLPPAETITESVTVDLTSTDFFRIDASAGEVAVSLPDPASVEDARGRRVTFVRLEGGGSGDATINGEDIPALESRTWISDDGTWYPGA